VPADQSVGWNEAQQSLTHDVASEMLELRPRLQIVALPTPIASSQQAIEPVADLAAQAADSLADARLSVSHRSQSRDLWDEALLRFLA
jgi:hypothetical protein